MTLLKAYPKCIVIETASPPVSPRVVAATFMTQKAKVTSGTLLELNSQDLFTGTCFLGEIARWPLLDSRHGAKAISDILQNTWKEVTILSCFEREPSRTGVCQPGLWKLVTIIASR